MRTIVIDGIRGWAALCVVLFHFYKELLKGVFPQVESTWWFFFMHGEFYVFVFFVLSGEALTTAFFKTKDTRKLDVLLIKRYFRLTIPIFLSTLIVYSIIRFGFDFHRDAAVTLKSDGWLARFLTNDTSFARMVKFSLVDVYTKHTTQMSFNPFLWTMSVEMVGSLLVFCVCYAWPRLRQPYTLVGVATVSLLCLGSYYSLFLAGTLIAAYKAQQKWKFAVPSRTTQILAFVVPVGCLATLQIFHNRTVPIAVYCTMSIAAVCCVQYNQIYSKLFSSKLSLYLGRISFPLYLTHFSVMISLTSYMHANSWFADQFEPIWASLFVSTIGVAVCLPVAHAFMLLESLIVPTVEKWVVQQSVILKD